MSSELTEQFLDEEYVDEDYVDEECVDENYVNNEVVEIPDWHMAILNERMERYRTADKSQWRTWEEVEKELLEKLAQPLKD